MENTYWNERGKYQTQYDELDKLIPAIGKAELLHIDLVRNIANLYYDHYNNGGCNWDLKKDQFEHIRYCLDELQPIAEKEGFDIGPLLAGFAIVYDDVWGDEDTNWYDEDDDGEVYRREPDTEKVWTLNETLERIADVVIRYAWEKQNS